MKKIGLTLRVEDARERRDCIDQAWYRVLAQHELCPVLLPNVAVDELAPGRLLEELGLSGVILTGGNDLVEVGNGENAAPERDRFESALLDACSQRAIAVLGVCRGLQKIVAHYGGALRPVDGHVGQPHSIAVRAGHSMPLTDRDAVNSFHSWGLRPEEVPRPLRVVATAADGTVEAVEHESQPLWGIMWHPERAPHDPRDGQIVRELFE